MPRRFAMILGRSVWLRDRGAWSRSRAAARGGRDPASRGELRGALSGPGDADTVLVYEPEDLAHQLVDTPRVSRSVFASLARVRSEHPFVLSQGLGWAMEPPQANPGGGFSTLVHWELSPGLEALAEACAGGARRLRTAWCCYSALEAYARRYAPSSQLVWFLSEDFAGLASRGPGRMGFKSWTGPFSDRDWKSCLAALREGDGRSPHTEGPVRVSGTQVSVVADGEPAGFCPIWRELADAGRIAGVGDLDRLARCVCELPRSHPSNLMQSFPRPRELDRFLLGAGACGLAGAAAMLAGLHQVRGASARADSQLAGTRRALELQLAHLESNRTEMAAAALREPDVALPQAPSRHQALRDLCEAVPPSMVLTSLSISGDGSFLMEAAVIGPGFDAEKTLRALAEAGFAPAAQKGWSYDAASGKVALRGRMGRRAP